MEQMVAVIDAFKAMQNSFLIPVGIVFGLLGFIAGLLTLFEYGIKVGGNIWAVAAAIAIPSIVIGSNTVNQGKAGHVWYCATQINDALTTKHYAIADKLSNEACASTPVAVLFRDHIIVEDQGDGSARYKVGNAPELVQRWMVKNAPDPSVTDKINQIIKGVQNG